MKQFYSLCMIMLLASVLAIDVMGQKTTLTVTGKVTDLEGDPLSGVSVVVQGTTRGTITNIDGAYSINVPSKQSVLVFSMISMKTVDHRVGNSTQINIIGRGRDWFGRRRGGSHRLRLYASLGLDRFHIIY